MLFHFSWAASAGLLLLDDVLTPTGKQITITIPKFVVDVGPVSSFREQQNR